MPRSSSGSHQSPALEPEYCPKHAHCWQQKAQNDERDRATQRVDHPVEIHTEEPGQEGDWQENQRYNGQAIDLLSLPLRRSEEHTSELQSRGHLVCRLLLEKKKK